MKITLVTVGKIKEKFYTDAIAEYAKRLSRYCKLEILQVADEKTPDKASEAEEQQIKEKKVTVFKYHKRNRYSKKQGYRRQLTALRVDEILF